MEKHVNCDESFEEKHETVSEKVNIDGNTGKENEADSLTVDTPCQGDKSASEKSALERLNSPLSDRISKSQAAGEIDNVMSGTTDADGETDETVSEGRVCAKEFESSNVSVKEIEMKCHENYIKGNAKCSADEKELDNKIGNNDSKICHAVGNSDVNDVETQEFAADIEERLSPEIGSRKKSNSSGMPVTPSKTPGKRRLKVHVFETELIGVKSTENNSEQFKVKENNESIKNPTSHISDRLITQGSLSHNVDSEPLTSSSFISQTESQMVYSGESLEASSSTTKAAIMPHHRTETENMPDPVRADECSQNAVQNKEKCYAEGEIQATSSDYESLKEQGCFQDGEVLASEKLVSENLVASESRMSAEAEKESLLSDKEQRNSQNTESKEEIVLLDPFASQVVCNKQDVAKLESNLVNTKDESSAISKTVEGCTNLADENNETLNKFYEGELLSSKISTACSLSEESLVKGDDNPETVKGNSKVIDASYLLVDESYCSSEDDEENISMNAVVVSPKITPRDLDHQYKETEEEIISDDSGHEREQKEGTQVDDKSAGSTDAEVVMHTETDQDKHSQNISYEDAALQEDFVEDRGMKIHHEEYDRDLEDEKGEKKADSQETLESIQKDGQCSVNDTKEYLEKEDRCSENSSEEVRMDVVKGALNNNSKDHEERESRSSTNTSEDVRMDVEEVMNNESEDCQERIDKSFKKTGEEIRMDVEEESLNNDSEDCQERIVKSSEKTGEEVRMNVNDETEDYQERDDKSSKNTNEEIKMDVEKEAMNNKFEDYKEREDNNPKKRSEEVRKDVNNESEDCQEREDKSSKNKSKEARMDAEKEVVNNVSEKYQERAHKTFEEVILDVEKETLNNDHGSQGMYVKADKSKEVKETVSCEYVCNEKCDEDISGKPDEKLPANEIGSEEKSLNETEQNSEITAGDSMTCDEKLEPQDFIDKNSEDVIMDIEKETLNNDHGSQGKYVKVDKSKESVHGEYVCNEKCDEDISGKPEEKLPANEIGSEEKSLNETEQNSNITAGDSMTCDEKLESQDFTDQSKILDNQPPHDESQEHSDETPSDKEKTKHAEKGRNQNLETRDQDGDINKGNSNEVDCSKELCDNSIDTETDSQDESELVIDDGYENQENVTLAEIPETQDHIKKDSIVKPENVAGNDLIHQQKSSVENSFEKLQTETTTKDIQEEEKSGDCDQNSQVTDKEGESDDLLPDVTESEEEVVERVESASKTEGKERMKKQADLEVCKKDVAKNIDTEKFHKVYGRKSITCKSPSNMGQDLSAVTAKSKRKTVAKDAEGFSPKAKVSKNTIDKSDGTKTGQKSPSDLQEIEFVAMEMSQEAVHCIDLSSDEEEDAKGHPSTAKPKVCHRCCDIWNDEVLLLIFKGTECVTVNSKITYGAIVLINNWINRNVSGDKKQVITSVFERADLGKNIAKLNISKLDHWLDQLLSSKTIKCCDVFTAVYCSDTNLGKHTSSMAKHKTIKANNLPPSLSKLTPKEISPPVSQNVDMHKNITLVPRNTLAPSQTNQGVKLSGVVPSERVTLVPSQISSGQNIILQTSEASLMKIIMSGATTSVPVSPHVVVPGKLPSVIRLGTPVNTSGLPVRSSQSSGQPKALYYVKPSLSQNVVGPSDLRMAAPTPVTSSLMTPVMTPSVVSATQGSSTMSINPKIGKIMSCSALKVLAADSSLISSLPGKTSVQMVEPASAGAGNKTPRSVTDTEVNKISKSVKSTRKRKKLETASVVSSLKSDLLNAPLLPSGAELHEKPATGAQDKTSSLTPEKLNTAKARSPLKKALTDEFLGGKKSPKKIKSLKNQSPLKASPNKQDESDMNRRADASDDEHFGDTIWDDGSDASDEMPDAVRNYKNTENVVTNNVGNNKNVDRGKSKNIENIIHSDAGSTLLETLGLDLKSTNIYMVNIMDSLITNEAMLKNPSAIEEKSPNYSSVTPGYFSMTKEHSALHGFAKEAFNHLMFEPHNFNVEKDGKLKSNRFVTKRELLTLQNMCILNAENPDANLFYEIFLQILLSRNQVLLIPDSRTLLLVTEEIRKEYNRAKAKDASIQILNKNWDVHNLYCAEDVLLRKGDIVKEPRVRDLIIVFCTWRNLKKNFPAPEFDEALQVVCKNVNLKNIDKFGLCLQFYIKYCRFLYEEKDKALARACLDEPFYDSQILATKQKLMAAKHGQTAFDRLNADEKEIECYINRCKELQKAAMNSPNQHIYENLCDEMIKLKVKLKNFTAVNNLMMKRIQAVETRRENIVKMVKHPQGKYLMRKLRNCIESTHKLFLKRYLDDHTDSRSAKRRKTLSNGDVSHSNASEDEIVTPQVQTLIENLLSKGVKPEQVKTVINTVLVNFEREVPLNLPSERWIKNFAKIIRACDK